MHRDPDLFCVKAMRPDTLGWLEYTLNPTELDYVWRCIDNKKESYNYQLAGHVSNSYVLVDRSDWFFHHTIKPLLIQYISNFGDYIGDSLPTNQKHPYYMHSWWVNYQKQGEFNPFHNHGGVYSFVIWMKIPFSWDKQNKKDIARKCNHPEISSFQFQYSTILGDMRTYNYELSSQDEGRMVLFPSKLSHQVYPFYDCNEERISVSGNVLLNTTKVV